MYNVNYYFPGVEATNSTVRAKRKHTAALRSIYSIPGNLDDQFLRSTAFSVRTAIPLAVAFGNKASM